VVFGCKAASGGMPKSGFLVRVIAQPGEPQALLYPGKLLANRGVTRVPPRQPRIVIKGLAQFASAMVARACSSLPDRAWATAMKEV
jgi:hypothetical protein